MGMIQHLTLFIRAFRTPRSYGGKRVWLIAALAPPLLGQAVANQAMLDLLQPKADIVHLPVGGKPMEKLCAGLILPMVILLLARKEDGVYLSLPGQNGAWLLTPALLAIRLKGNRALLHHHSFRLIGEGPNLLGHALAKIGGDNQGNLFLSEGMRARYAALYLTGRQSAQGLVLSNAALMAPDPASPSGRDHARLTLGHISVMRPEKGVDYVLALSEGLLAAHADIHILLAGPCGDRKIQAAISRFIAAHPGRAIWLGPVGNAGKAAFYHAVDGVLLPSRLKDEAEPLTLFEAYRHGVRVFATPIGCVTERIADADDLLSLDLDQDLARVTRWLDQRRAQPHRCGQSCRRHARKLRDEALGNIPLLLSALQITGAAEDISHRVDDARSVRMESPAS